MTLQFTGTDNILLDSDSYKYSMPWQYPSDMKGIFLYGQPRGGRWDKVMFTGLQPILLRLAQGFTMEMIEEANELLQLHGEPFDIDRWKLIFNRYGGKLPMRICAVPEGTIVPNKNVLWTVESTDPDFAPLVTQFEDMLLRVWYPITVATESWQIRQLIKGYLESTGDVSGLDFKLHDFGNRGVSSVESAMIGGLAHLSTGALGTDTVPALVAARRWYGYKGAAGFSIPAMEHSTVTSWGREFESDAYRNMLKRFGGQGKLFAAVSDSYDVFNAASKIWGEELKDEIVNSGSVVVIRPDSGDPVDVNRKLIEILGARFGYTVNAKGFKVLNTVRLIQGDGVDYNTIDSILRCFQAAGWSADNIAFGMGGALLQKCDRDTLKFAQKCSSINRAGVWQDVQKDPITDSGKKSFAGRVTLMRNLDGSLYSGREDWVKTALVTVFEDGEVLKTYTLDEVRARANS